MWALIRLLLHIINVYINNICFFWGEKRHATETQKLHYIFINFVATSAFLSKLKKVTLGKWAELHDGRIYVEFFRGERRHRHLQVLQMGAVSTICPLLTFREDF